MGVARPVRRAPAAGLFGWLPRLLGRLRRSRRGMVLVEMAFAIPILLTLLMGALEIARYVLIMQKLDRTAMSVGDLVSRGAQMTNADLDNIFDSVRHLMQPFAFPDKGVVIVSAVTRAEGDPPEIVWQRAGAGTISQASEVGTAGGTASLPQNLTPRANESLYVAEVFFDFEPLLFEGFVGPRRLYHWSAFRARLSDQVVTIE
jgi:hypothetical protein